MVMPSRGGTLFTVDSKFLCFAPFLTSSPHDPLCQHIAKTLSPRNPRQHRHHCLPIAPNHFNALCFIFADNTFFVAFHEPSNKPTGLIRIHSEPIYFISK